MEIHVAYTVDIQGGGAMQFSDQIVVGLAALKETKRNEDSIVVHILYANIPGDLILRCLSFSSTDFKISFTRIKPSDLQYMQQFTNNSPTANVRTWNGIVYARLWLARALPLVDRVIYLDIDTMVRKSLHELYEMEMDDKLLGMVMGHTIEYGYNSGVILMNCKRMREREGLWDQLDEFMTEHSKTFFLPDQTTINKFFANDIFELPLKYNYPPKPASSNVASSENDVSDAVIWHFYFPGPKQHRLDEYERCNLLWNSCLQKCEQQNNNMGN